MDGAITVVAATDIAIPQTREAHPAGSSGRRSYIIVFTNKCDMVDDELLELVEMEVRELLSQYDFRVTTRRSFVVLL